VTILQNPENFSKRLIELYGGREKALEALNKRFDNIKRRFGKGLTRREMRSEIVCAQTSNPRRDCTSSREAGAS
jgi:hypothetical protein